MSNEILDLLVKALTECKIFVSHGFQIVRTQNPYDLLNEATILARIAHKNPIWCSIDPVGQIISALDPHVACQTSSLHNSELRVTTTGKPRFVRDAPSAGDLAIRGEVYAVSERPDEWPR